MILLSMHSTNVFLFFVSDRRGDMICLVRDVATPQVFFNSEHIATSCAGLESILKEWNRQNDDLPILRFFLDIQSAPDPVDSKLRPPPSQTTTKDIFVMQFNPTLIPLPDGTSMKKLAVIRHLLQRLPRRSIIDKHKEYTHAFRGYEAIVVWRQWLHISAKEAITFAESLINHGIVHKLTDITTSEFQEMALYRLQPLQTPEVLNTFCLAVPIGESISPHPTQLMNNLCDLMDSVFSSSDSPRQMVKNDAYSCFQESVAQLQMVSLSIQSVQDRTAFTLNLYNLMVRHALIEFHESNWQGMLPIICYNIGGDEVTLNELSYTLLYGRREDSKKRNKWRQFLLGGCRSPPETMVADARFYFCLSWGCKSSPRFRTYHAQHLELELQTASEEYCQEFITMDEDLGVVTLPALFSWHAIDFGGSGCSMVERMIHHLSRKQCDVLIRMHHKYGTSLKIQYSEFDWTKLFGSSKKCKTNMTSFMTKQTSLCPPTKLGYVDSVMNPRNGLPLLTTALRAPSQVSIRTPLGSSSLQPPCRKYLSPEGYTKTDIHSIVPHYPRLPQIHTVSLPDASCQQAPRQQEKNVSYCELVAPKGRIIPHCTLSSKASSKETSVASGEKHNPVFFDLVLPPKYEHQVSGVTAISALTTDWMVADIQGINAAKSQ